VFSKTMFGAGPSDSIPITYYKKRDRCKTKQIGGQSSNKGRSGSLRFFRKNDLFFGGGEVSQSRGGGGGGGSARSKILKNVFARKKQSLKSVEGVLKKGSKRVENWGEACDRCRVV